MKNVLLILVCFIGVAIAQTDAQSCCNPCPPECCIMPCNPDGTCIGMDQMKCQADGKVVCTPEQLTACNSANASAKNEASNSGFFARLMFKKNCNASKQDHSTGDIRKSAGLTEL